MIKRIVWALVFFLLALAARLALWPVPIRAWRGLRLRVAHLPLIGAPD